MNEKDTHKYDDIIHLPHHVSARHPQMSLMNRAAQFSPFASLTGHGAAIQETARLTDSFVELEEDQKEQLDEQLLKLREEPARNPEVEAVYFQPDARKDGGAYVTIRGTVKKIDGYRRRILFTDGTTVPMDMLFSIEIIDERS